MYIYIYTLKCRKDLSNFNPTPSVSAISNYIPNSQLKKFMLSTVNSFKLMI